MISKHYDYRHATDMFYMPHDEFSYTNNVLLLVEKKLIYT